MQRRLGVEVLQDFGAWQSKVLAAMEEAKVVCRRETGDSGERHFWTGYDTAFLACMNVQGWSRPRGTDPL